VCDPRPFIEEFDWDLVLICLLLGSENVRWDSLGRLQDGADELVKIGNVTSIHHRIVNYIAERSFWMDRGGELALH